MSEHQELNKIKETQKKYRIVTSCWLQHFSHAKLHNRNHTLRFFVCGGKREEGGRVTVWLNAMKTTWRILIL